MRCLKFFFWDNSVCIVYSEFTSGVDAVLPFPKFYKPGSLVIVKINGFVIKNHIEVSGRKIKKGVIPKRFLKSGMTPEEVAKRMDVPIKFVNSCMR